MTTAKFEPFLVPNLGWNVRTKTAGGQYLYLTTGGPYTQAQAQVAADSLRRDTTNHGAAHVLGGMLIAY